MFPESHRKGFEKECKMSPEELVERIREIRLKPAVVDGQERPAIGKGEAYTYNWDPSTFPTQEV